MTREDEEHLKQRILTKPRTKPELEAEVEKRRTIEEVKKIVVKDKIKSKAEESKEPKTIMLKPHIITGVPQIAPTGKMKLKIKVPTSESLTNLQKLILGVLCNIGGKKVLDVIKPLEKALSIQLEVLEREILQLERQGYISLKNGYLNLTEKGITVSSCIEAPYSIIEKLREDMARIPQIPSLKSLPLKFKPLNKELITLKIYEKTIQIPSIPHINVGRIGPKRPLDTQKPLLKQPYLGQVIVPPFPDVKIPEIKGKEIIKTTPTIVIGKETVKIIPETVVSERKRKRRVPSSLLMVLFKSVKGYSVKGLLSVKPERPVIVIAVKPKGDNYIDTLVSILREIFRMKAGGLPILRHAVKSKHIVVEEYIKQHFIKIIDDAEGDFLEFFEKIKNAESFDKVDLGKLKERLSELSSAGFGFLVFYVGEDKVNNLLQYLHGVQHVFLPAKIVVVELRRMSSEYKRLISRIAWGFAEPREPPREDTLDWHFRLREGAFNDVLEKLSTIRRYVENVRESIEAEEGIEGYESPLHYQLKVLTVYYLTRKLKIKRDNVETEVAIKCGNREVIPDVYVRSKGIAVEIETFYGTGLTPWRKLQRTMEKYLEGDFWVHSGIREVWIVIPPLQTLLYFRDLMDKIRELKSKNIELFKFYTVDVAKRKLVSLEEISKILRKAHKNLKALHIK